MVSSPVRIGTVARQAECSQVFWGEGGLRDYITRIALLPPYRSAAILAPARDSPALDFAALYDST